jgi:hypothetical protein
MTRSEATEIARKYIKAREMDAGCELVLLEKETLERKFGWVFFYDSKQHAETADFRHALAGNAPIVITRADGVVHETGTAMPLEQYLTQYDA